MKGQPLPLENCIRAWESSLFHDKFLMSPDTRVIVEATTKYLKELKELKEVGDSARGQAH